MASKAWLTQQHKSQARVYTTRSGRDAIAVMILGGNTLLSRWSLLAGVVVAGYAGHDVRTGAAQRRRGTRKGAVRGVQSVVRVFGVFHCTAPHYRKR